MHRKSLARHGAAAQQSPALWLVLSSALATTACEKEEPPTAAPTASAPAKQTPTRPPTTEPSSAPVPTVAATGAEYCHPDPKFCLKVPEGFAGHAVGSEPEWAFENKSTNAVFGVRWHDSNEDWEGALKLAKENAASAHKLEIVEEGKTDDGKGATLTMHEKGETAKTFWAMTYGPPRAAPSKALVFNCIAGDDFGPQFPERVAACKTIRVP